jgi:FAD/FMN-containing dehydrogenase
VLLPSGIDDVSFIVKKLFSVNGYGKTACPWAVTGGGHMPNRDSANIDGGITISLASLADVSLNKDKSIVSIGGGARWKSVYDKLTPLGLSTAGGRNDYIGVGGLVTGGE